MGDELPTTVFGHWVQAGQEGDVGVYRRFGTPLPPARGRRAFEIRPDGAFLHHGIGPTDATRTSAGKWRAEGPRRIRAEFPGTDLPPETLDVVEVGDDVLKVRRTRG
jgi:hypothetical protein